MTGLLIAVVILLAFIWITLGTVTKILGELVILLRALVVRQDLDADWARAYPDPRRPHTEGN